MIAKEQLVQTDFFYLLDSPPQDMSTTPALNEAKTDFTRSDDRYQGGRRHQRMVSEELQELLEDRNPYR